MTHDTYFVMPFTVYYNRRRWKSLLSTQIRNRSHFFQIEWK